MNAPRARALASLFALFALATSAALAAVPSKAPAAPAAPSAPVADARLLAWTDDPPATEVRPLSGARTVALRYGAALDPTTFHATLDGERVSDAFKPEPGTSETVALGFIGGRNHLVLQASSKDGLTHITLERWIVFARFPGDENAEQRVPSAPELKHEIWKKETPEAGAPPPAAAPTTKP
jgi:hypothetical protein